MRFAICSVLPIHFVPSNTTLRTLFLFLVPIVFTRPEPSTTTIFRDPVWIPSIYGEGIHVVIKQTQSERRVMKGMAGGLIHTRKHALCRGRRCYTRPINRRLCWRGSAIRHFTRYVLHGTFHRNLEMFGEDSSSSSGCSLGERLLEIVILLTKTGRIDRHR